MIYDILVLGTGPAGLSAAVQARARGKEVLVVGNDYRQSPLYRAELVENYLGIPNISGAALLDAFSAHATSSGAVMRAGRVLNILPSGGIFQLNLGDEVLSAKSVILATGVIRSSKYPGEDAFLGRGVSYCATCDGMLYRGKSVTVVGKAPDAPAEANFLSEIGCRVTYVSAREPQGLNPAIPFHKADKLEVIGEAAVTALRADGTDLACAGVFILRPAIAPSDLLPGLALDGSYIAVDGNQQTNIAGVFAAGDCTGTPLQIANAVGDGLIAGQRAAEYLDKL